MRAQPRALVMLTAAVALATAGSSTAAVRGQVPAHADIIEPMMVQLSWPMAMPTVRGAGNGAAFLGQAPSASMGMMMPGNPMMLVRREDTTGAVATAPATFEVAADSASDNLIVRTSLAGEVRIDGQGAILAGAIPDGAAASIGVSRLGQAGSDRSPLAIVVQFN